MSSSLSSSFGRNEELLQKYENGYDRGYKAARTELESTTQLQPQQSMLGMNETLMMSVMTGDQSVPQTLSRTSLTNSYNNSNNNIKSSASLLTTLTRNVSDNIFRSGPTVPTPRDDPELLAELDKLRVENQRLLASKKMNEKKEKSERKGRAWKAKKWYCQVLTRRAFASWKDRIRIKRLTKRVIGNLKRRKLGATFSTWKITTKFCKDTKQE